MSAEDTIRAREARYGDFAHRAKLAQRIQNDMRCSNKWGALAPDQQHALAMIAEKISRLLNGDPDQSDTWHDIAGYAMLVEARLNRTAPPPPSPPTQALDLHRAVKDVVELTEKQLLSPAERAALRALFS